MSNEAILPWGEGSPARVGLDEAPRSPSVRVDRGGGPGGHGGQKALERRGVPSAPLKRVHWKSSCRAGVVGAVGRAELFPPERVMPVSGMGLPVAGQSPAPLRCEAPWSPGFPCEKTRK